MPDSVSAAGRSAVGESGTQSNREEEEEEGGRRRGGRDRTEGKALILGRSSFEQNKVTHR